MSEHTEPKDIIPDDSVEPIDLSDYREPRLDPFELEDDEVYEFFVSQCLHPAIAKHPELLADFIQANLSEWYSGELSPQQEIWKSRLEGLKVDIDSFDPKVKKKYIDADQVLSMMQKLIIGTRDDAADLREERKALLWLRELRAGVSVRDNPIDSQDEKWKVLLATLFPGRQL